MKTRNRQTVCRRKRRYGTARNAERARRATGTERSARGLVVYVCEFCHGFHVGHRSVEDRQRSAATPLLAENWQQENRPT